MAALAPTTDGLVVRRSAQLRWLTVLYCAGGLGLGLLAGALSLGGHTAGIVLVAGLALPIVIWKWPRASIILAMVIATMFEQFPVDPWPAKSVPLPLVTDQLPLFQSLNDGMGLSGVLLNPLELIILLTALVWLMKGVAQRDLQLPRSALAGGLAILFVLALLAEVHGLMAGGDLRESLRELRPWVYLGVFYLLAAQLLARYGGPWALLWAFVIGTGIKGVEGTIRFVMVRGSLPRPEAILAHEEAVFFGVFLLLTATLWIFGEKGRLRSVATALAPFVFIANVGNNRRASWLILGLGLAALLVIAWVRLPNRRRLVGGGMALLMVIGAVYLPIFWSGSGGFSQPARAIRSLVGPDPRDAASNQYRVQEDANLEFNIQRSTPFGAGFGLAIDYALPIVDLTVAVPSLKYVPHNTILYTWMRMGLLGMFAFWWLIGIGFLTAFGLIRSLDRRLMVFGALAICALIAYLLEGYYDLGLSWFRVGVFMGCVLGALEAARQLQHSQISSAALRETRS
jgi:hypothetical protein